MPDNEVILDKRGFDLPESVSDEADCRIVSGWLARLSVAVAALLMLEDRGEALLLETEAGRSLEAGLRFKTDRLGLTTFWFGSAWAEWLGSESFVVRDEWERLNLARTLNAVGGGEVGYGGGEDEGASRLGREENPPSDMGVEGLTD